MAFSYNTVMFYILSAVILSCCFIWNILHVEHFAEYRYLYFEHLPCYYIWHPLHFKCSCFWTIGHFSYHLFPTFDSLGKIWLNALNKQVIVQNYKVSEFRYSLIIYSMPTWYLTVLK